METMNNRTVDNDTMNNGITYSEIKLDVFFIDKLKKHTEVDNDFDIVRLLSDDKDNPEVCYLVDEIKKKNPVFNECNKHNKAIDKAKTDLIFKAMDLLTNFVMDKIFDKPDKVKHIFGSGLRSIELGYMSSEFGDLYIELKVCDNSATISSCTIDFNDHEFQLIEDRSGEDCAYVLVYKPTCATDDLFGDWKSARFGHKAFKHMCEHLIPSIAMEIYKANNLQRKAEILNHSCGVKQTIKPF